MLEGRFGEVVPAGRHKLRRADICNMGALAVRRGGKAGGVRRHSRLDVVGGGVEHGDAVHVVAPRPHGRPLRAPHAICAARHRHRLLGPSARRVVHQQLHRAAGRRPDREFHLIVADGAAEGAVVRKALIQHAGQLHAGAVRHLAGRRVHLAHRQLAAHQRVDVHAGGQPQAGAAREEGEARREGLGQPGRVHAQRDGVAIAGQRRRARHLQAGGVAGVQRKGGALPRVHAPREHVPRHPVRPELVEVAHGERVQVRPLQEELVAAGDGPHLELRAAARVKQLQDVVLVHVQLHVLLLALVDEEAQRVAILPDRPRLGGHRPHRAKVVHLLRRQRRLPGRALPRGAPHVQAPLAVLLAAAAPVHLDGGRCDPLRPRLGRRRHPHGRQPAGRAPRPRAQRHPQAAIEKDDRAETRHVSGGEAAGGR
mmetsp:Transcript_6434/g.16658  ORF Transcript_6434/g.16658 Transcript_6434/m.16658 type:complete len:425 (+) Transcript_6434:951-2225(+)